METFEKFRSIFPRFASKEHFMINNRIQIFIGTAVLLFGSLVYLVDRPPEQTYFIYNSAIDISLYKILPALFGAVGNSLPTFVHVFSFILLTAGFISCRKTGYMAICLSWFLVDMVFELGQKFSQWSIKIIPGWFDGIPFLENTRNYFVNGTFDIIDVAAIVLGTIAAYFILTITMERGKGYETAK